MKWFRREPAQHQADEKVTSMLLCIAGEKPVSRRLEAALSRAGFKTENFAANAPGSGAGPADLIIMDSSFVTDHCPSKAVAELRLRPELRHCPIIYLLPGEKAAAQIVPQIWAAGITLILPEPYTESELILAVKRVLSSERLTFEAQEL